MSVSNKTLAIMLLAAIVVSLGGTFISLSRLGTMSTPTGHATDDSQGNITLTIDEILSITTIDNNLIDFGTCELGADSAGITINSEQGADTDNCSNVGDVEAILVRNNGNLDANVTIQAASVGTDQGGAGPFFLDTGSSNSSLQYKFMNESHASYEGGCMSGMGPSSYTDFAEPATEYTACELLQSHSSDNSIGVDFQISVPDSASEGDNVTITFTASESI